MSGEDELAWARRKKYAEAYFEIYDNLDPETRRLIAEGDKIADGEFYRKHGGELIRAWRLAFGERPPSGVTHSYLSST